MRKGMTHTGGAKWLSKVRVILDKRPPIFWASDDVSNILPITGTHASSAFASDMTNYTLIYPWLAFV